MLMLRVNAAVTLVVTIINIVMLGLANLGCFESDQTELMALMCCCSFGFTAVEIGGCVIDSREIEVDNEIIHTAGAYTLMALLHCLFAALYAWTACARM